MVDGLLSLRSSTNFLATGQLPMPTGNDHALVAPYGLFTAQDGEIAIAPSNDGVYAKFIQVLEPRRCSSTLTSARMISACSTVRPSMP